MNQKKLINLYESNFNSMFDDSDIEDNEEMIDTIKTSSKFLNGVLSVSSNPELFHCIVNMMDNNSIHHSHKDCLTENELESITFIKGHESGESYFQKFNPKDGDYSIIFKYLKNIEIIDSNAFNGCEYLKKIVLPDKITDLKHCAFFNCKNLVSIKLSKNIEGVGDQCFYNCHNLQSISFHDNLISIEHEAFSNCFSLYFIGLPNTLIKISWNAFENCSGLKSIIIPDSVKEMTTGVFAGCENLEHIHLSSNLFALHTDTFKYCFKLLELVVPKNVSAIQENTFSSDIKNKLVSLKFLNPNIKFPTYETQNGEVKENWTWIFNAWIPGTLRFLTIPKKFKNLMDLFTKNGQLKNINVTYI